MNKKLYIELMSAEIERLRDIIVRKDDEISDLKDLIDPTRQAVKKICREMASQVFSGLDAWVDPKKDE